MEVIQQHVFPATCGELVMIDGPAAHFFYHTDAPSGRQSAMHQSAVRSWLVGDVETYWPGWRASAESAGSYSTAIVMTMHGAKESADC
jgi:hypothetical protein